MQKVLLLFWMAVGFSAAGAEIKIPFGEFPAGTALTNFQSALAGAGQPGNWRIISETEPSALQPMIPVVTPTAMVTRHVLAQLRAEPNNDRFPMLIYEKGPFRNFTVTTRFKIAGGMVEEMAGMVFRYQNSSNFYVFRASALGENLRFYKMVNGVMGNFIGPAAVITTNAWHTLAVQCQGDQITCLYDGQPAMPTLHDTSFSTGRIGFWTMADSKTYFGDTTIHYTPIVPAAQVLVEDMMQEYPLLIGLRIYMLDDKGRSRIVASNDKAEIGRSGTSAETKTMEDGAVFFGRGKGTVAVDLPLNNRNGDPIAAVRVRMKSHALGQTEDMVVARARVVVARMQQRVLSKQDLE
ncbi:MAG: hypothetical protein KGR98_05360 [Verrucomicrobia bacterium]|nr:hypothetical protein [Verrucomicrobiota bacterium]MDE3098867.1 hypothetical protein [Verrucomicrobiota bacterium]